MKKLLVLGTLFLLPTLVLAAGFPKQSIFLSKDSVTEGDTVLIHTIVSNTGTTSFSGKLRLLDGQTNVGSLVVLLPPSAAQVSSLSWKPTAGSHIITADLYDVNQNLVEEEKSTFDILSPPTTNSEMAISSTTQVEPSKPVQSAVANISPVAAEKITPLLTTIDASRNYVVRALDTGIAWTKKQSATSTPQSQGLVLGTQTTKAPVPPTDDVLHQVWTWVAQFLSYILEALRYGVSHVALFYPILAFIILYVLWRLSKGIRKR